MKRLLCLFAFAAVLFITAPAPGFAEDELNLDLAAKTYSTCGPNIEALVYLDQGLDGTYDPPEDGLKDEWGVLLYAFNDNNWTFIGSALTGGSDGTPYAGSDTGKVWFRSLQTNMDYVVCARFPRDWLFMTQPVASRKNAGVLLETGGWNNATVEVIPNPFPLAWDDPQPGERNWDETTLCYKVRLRSTSNNVRLRFGILTYDTAGNPVMF